MGTEVEIAWAAGFFEGEGAAWVRGRRPRLQLSNVQEEPVRRFCAIVGRGKVYGPYKNRTGEKDGYQRSDFWVWVAEGSDALQVAALLEPYLSGWRLRRGVAEMAICAVRTG